MVLTIAVFCRVYQLETIPVTDIDAIPVAMDVSPLESEFGLAPYVSNHASVESVTRMLIRIDTDESVVGWGEMLVAMKSAAVTRAVIEDVIAPELIGRELGSIQKREERSSPIPRTAGTDRYVRHVYEAPRATANARCRQDERALFHPSAQLV